MVAVLIFPAGSGVAQEIYASLASCKDILLIGADANITLASYVIPYVYEVAPMIKEDACIRDLKKLIVDHDIDYVIPALDDALVFLKIHESSLGARVACSPLDTVLTTRSKRLTYELLASVVRVPTILDEDPNDLMYPVFVKPDAGEGSKRCRVARHKDELVVADDELVVEYLPGEEFTVDCFSKDGFLLFVGPRRRTVRRGGIAVVTRTVTNDDEFMEFARKIHGVLEFHGAWFFQAKRTWSGRLALLEIAPRIAGASACHRAMGVNLSLLTLELFRGRNPVVPQQRFDVEACKVYETRINTNLAYENAYFDLDDTLYVDGFVNTTMLALVHKIRNAGKRVYLVTRHNANPRHTLESVHVKPSLFDAIHHVTDGSSKKVVMRPNSIFFDDSFFERQSCHDEVQRIYSFDVDAAALFLNS